MRYPVDFSEESLAQASMRSPSIVVGDVLVNCSLQVLATKYEDVIETFVTAGTLLTFCDRIGPWSFHRRTNLPDF